MSAEASEKQMRDRELRAKAWLLGSWAALSGLAVLTSTWNRGIAQLLVVAVPTMVAVATRPAIDLAHRAKAALLRRRVLRQAEANTGPVTPIARAAPPFVHVQGHVRPGSAADEIELTDESGTLRVMLGAMINESGRALQPGAKVDLSGPATWGPTEGGSAYRTTARRLIVSGAPGAPSRARVLG